MNKLIRDYRIKRQTTPEELEMGEGKVITFGDKIIMIGYYYHRDNNCYIATIYEFIGDDHTVEGPLELKQVSEERFIDDGHAIEWALKQVK